MSDILSPALLSFVLTVGLGSILFWAGALWFFRDLYNGIIATYIQKIPFVGNWEWFQDSGTVVGAIVVGYMMVIITISLLTSLLSEPLLLKLAKKHYPNQPVVGSPKITTSILLSLKAGALFLLLFLLTFPLVFVPVFGQIWMLWLWSLLIKEPTTYDVGALFIKDEKEMNTQKKRAWKTAIIASLFNYLPLLNIFAPLFGQILFLHQILGAREPKS